MFSLGVSPQEIQDVLSVIKGAVYPKRYSLRSMTEYIFGNVDPIKMRKVRLAIKILRKQGWLIIANNGYSMAGDDPTEVIHFINGMYSRAHSLTIDADIMYHGLKQKYGDVVGARVEQLPKQAMLNEMEKYLNPLFQKDIAEPPFRKSIDARGNEIALQFEADA